jgi:hypothetical protein
MRDQVARPLFPLTVSPVVARWANTLAETLWFRGFSQEQTGLRMSGSQDK